MSTTTQILFNSPALHSLKRDQLVKLCKIHSIKASGKNVELIQKLKQHALQLPKDSPLSIAARSEQGGPIPIQPQAREEETEEEISDDASYRTQIPRQSEQWEMVMDSIEELEEGSSQNTLSSQRTLNNGGTGEFGTGGSKSTTVSSSIKALATSLGLKRGNPKSAIESTSSSKNSAFAPIEVDDELSLKSTPYSSLPPPTFVPQTDHFTLDNRMSIDGNTEAPLPGTALRPGVPAPANARLSLGLGLGAPATPMRQAQPTTTIRLVSNPLSNHVDLSYAAGDNGTPQLKPFKTTFDLSFGSPAPGGSTPAFGFGNTSSWPPRRDGDVQMKGIYPTLTFDDLPPSVPGSPAVFTANSPEPFVFGSPLPKNNVSDEAFRAAAASVLEEMNQRLREDGVDEIESDIIAKLHPNAKKGASREIKPIPSSKRGGEITDKFQKLHEEEFQKMEGIDSLVKKRAQNPQAKKSAEEKVVLGKKRKSSAIERDSGAGLRRPSAVAGRASATRVISNGRRAKVLPGAFGMDDDDDDEEEEENRDSKRVRMDPDAPPSTLTPEEEQKQHDEEQRRRVELEQEKEAIRRKLEANRARRRSSAAHGGTGPRKSIGGPRKSILVKPQPKPSRFGFLSSAKTLVQNVWNRGKAPAETPAAQSNIPKPVVAAKLELPKAKMGPPSFMPAKKASAAPARPTTAVASGSKAPTVRITDPKQKATEDSSGTKASVSSRSRSPLPTFNTRSSRNSLLTNGSIQPSRTSSIAGSSSRTSSIMGTGVSRSRTSSTNVSSVGTRTSATRMSAVGSVGSMGIKKMMGGSSNSRTSMAGTASSSRLSSMSSRLFAPTASSLAKTHKSSTPLSSGLKPVSEDKHHTQSTLSMTTNSPSVASPALKLPFGTPGTFSPRSGAIFSKPLAMHHQSSIPTPIKKRTLSCNSPADADEDGSHRKQATTSATSTTPAPTRVRSLNGRKPRISRSKVIARLASQRAASGNSTASGSSHKGLAPRASGVGGAGKTRSSLGAKVSRASYGGGTKSRPSMGGTTNGVMMSAKKRARQSEYARRRSRVGPANFDGPSAAAGSEMDT